VAATNKAIPLSLEGIESALARTWTVADRRAYLESLRRRVAQYEQRYQLPSSILREALQSRKLRENLDVVKWLHAHETLVGLENGQEARLERSRKLPARRAASRAR
jgi:hypothetical protein